jgi:hypothetical protein
MTSDRNVEHYATLFDNHFLLQGLCLHQSLAERATPFHLWILCVDEVVERNLLRINLPNVTLLPLREVETDRLREVKGDRSIGEYCWTLTPFLPQFVFEKSPDVKRVTYLDADLYLFDDPAPFFSEFERARKHVLITDHAYAPGYDKSALVGRFCVQFLTFRNTQEAKHVISWWQQRCLEWCYAREEDDKFGDQKYLDAWPQLFREEVHILSQQDRTLAPWNVLHIERKTSGRLSPVFYHFHDLRIHPNRRVTLYSAYRIGKTGQTLYAAYLQALRGAARRVEGLGMAFGTFSQRSGWRAFAGRLQRRFLGTEMKAFL